MKKSAAVLFTITFGVAFIFVGLAWLFGRPRPIAFETTQIEVNTSHHDPILLTVELAKTRAQRARGLMYRNHLPVGHGMLFSYRPARVVQMWMRNTVIPLDILFIDGHGRIEQVIANARPTSDTIITSAVPVRYVLEINGGSAQDLNVKAGDRIDFLTSCLPQNADMGSQKTISSCIPNVNIGTDD
ncbi:DUF192 domain-containing protein [Agrobacterium vitis]|uniref:DUF192 domain-containing protein n=1 Tax=Agrobacterium vitis TaxID=373 RepID=UPI001573CDA2|nr:DUF192 domain-containing protein [Agrobacterium vitis]NSZ19479.1 DUF192 domain-containing protein [Agrobacterium vitis]QZO06864.1 DUF192 domain-containing protein [Agrobacterium vitis]UJL91525.1 DUF192 domain-containing protein [Agrobacterium vitis]